MILKDGERYNIQLPKGKIHNARWSWCDLFFAECSHRFSKDEVIVTPNPVTCKSCLKYQLRKGERR